MPKFFLTGGSGFIGYHIHQSIPQHQIVNFGRSAPSFSHQSTFIQGNICDFKALDKAMRNYPCEAILHLAGEWRDFGLSEKTFFEVNAKGTENVVKAAEKNHIEKILYFSSVAVYGNLENPADESSPTKPESVYGKSKLAGEKILIQWSKEKPSRELIIFRPAGIYGEENSGNMLRLIKQIHSGLYFNIGKADNIKSTAYVKNIVDATWFLINKMKPGFEIYNYVDKPQLSVRATVELIAGSLGKSKPITLPVGFIYVIGVFFDLIIKIFGKNLPISTYRINKLRKATNFKADKILKAGFRPKYDNIQGLKSMVKWYLSKKEN